MPILKKYHVKNFVNIWRRASSKFGKGLNVIFYGLVRFYQMTLSPVLGGHCRFNPTCSEYAAHAFQKHSFPKAFSLTIKRISKCHPFGPYGHDPLPEKHHD